MYRILDVPITDNLKRTIESPHSKVEDVIRVENRSVFCVVVRRVDVSNAASLNESSAVVRFSESEFAIPNSKIIRLRTAAYYRDLEENTMDGIGDSEEAIFRRDTDMDAFQREAGQTPISGAHNVQLGLTHTRECWVLSTSNAQTSPAGMERMRSTICRDYDATTLIADKSQFAKQLGVDFGNAFRSSDLKVPDQTWWLLSPTVIVDHGSVTYSESPSGVIGQFPRESWGLVTPFVKRTQFSGQKEYRFVVSVSGSGAPKESYMDLPITEELRALTCLLA